MYKFFLIILFIVNVLGSTSCSDYCVESNAFWGNDRSCKETNQWPQCIDNTPNTDSSDVKIVWDYGSPQLLVDLIYFQYIFGIIQIAILLVHVIGLYQVQMMDR